MADDKKPMNGVGNKRQQNRLSEMDFGRSEIERIGRQFEKTPLAEQEMKASFYNAQNQLRYLSELPEDLVANTPRLARMMNTAPSTMTRNLEAHARSVSSRVERSNTQAMNSVERRFSDSAINGMASSMSRDPNVAVQSMGMAGMSYQDLTAQRQKIQNQIGSLGAQSADLASGLFSEKGVDPQRQMRLDLKRGSASTLVGQLASVDHAMRLQEQQGLDPRSRAQNAFSAVNEARGRQTANAIGQELANTGGVSINSDGGSQHIARKDIGTALNSETEKLVKAFEKLQEAVSKGEKDLSSYNEKIEDASKNIEKLKTAQGGSDEKRGNTMAYLSAAAGMFGAVGNGAQQVLVNQRMQDVNNIAGFAGVANQQYDMYRKARGGDVASQMAMSNWDAADTFGMEMKRGTNVAQSAYLAGSAVQTGVGIAQAAEAGAQKINVVSHIAGNSTNNTQSLINGMQNAVQGGVATGVTGMDMARGSSAQAARLQGIQARMQAHQAINYVGATQAQGLRDFYTNLDGASQGAGLGSNSFLESASSIQNLSRMGNNRIGTDQFAQLSQQGFEQMGSTFNTEQIYASRNLEKKGFGSMSQNMGRMSALSDAGANNPQEGLEQVLSAAVARGMDTSKAINLMVDHTANMVSTMGTSTAAGINNTASVASELAANTDPNNPNKEFALNRAAQISSVVNGTTGDISATFSGMVNTARIGQATGLEGEDAINAAKLTPADIKTMQTMNPEEAKKAAMMKGVNLGKANGDISVTLNKLLDAGTSQMFSANGGMLHSAKDQDALKAAAVAGKSYDQLTEQQQDVVGKLGSRTGITGKEYFAGAAGIKNANIIPNVNGKELTDETTGTGGKKGEFDMLRTGGMKQMTDAATAAAIGLGKFGTALEVFVKLQKSVEEGGVQKESGFTEAASKFAGDFSASTGMFKSSVTEFGMAVAALSTKAGLTSNGNPVKPEFLSNAEKDQKKGSTR